MFFTRFGRVVAILALVVGVFNVAAGMMIATETIGPYEAALARYFPTARSSGAVIDKGILVFLFGIILGILTEIRYALRAQS
jgi:hypothetical protein